MKQQCLVLLLLLLCSSMVGCSPGHLGSNEIAFIRDGHLWTIDPDGANAFDVAADSTPIASYGWSPNHQLLVFRTLDASFAKSSAAKQIVSNPTTQVPGDLPSTISTIGIDGGSPIPIIPSSPDVLESSAWWNASGNRLLYREELNQATLSPNTTLWWISQNDQPNGIARKLLPSSFSIPSLDYHDALALGNANHGIFTTTLAGTDQRYVVRGELPGHPLPATLERVLWQPAHPHPGILYALTESSPQIQPFNAPTPQVQLVLRAMDGHTTHLTTCACTQFAWAPDGNHILYSTGPTYTILTINGNTAFTFTAEEGSIPYWSPDSHFLLLDGLHTLTLIQVAREHQQVLLSDASGPPATTSPPDLSVNALLQPVSNSLWAADSSHFLFLTRGRMLWQGKALSSGKGLYTVTLDTHGLPQSAPSVVDTGNDIQAGWTYEDPNTSFLF